MALVYDATLTPSKTDLLARWLPGRPWLGDVDPDGFTVAGRFRFDDPAGEVGVETYLLRTADGTLLHVPLTYRPAPLLGADDALVGRADHSVLGPRWVYDGCADPVYVSAVATAVLTGGTEAAQEMATPSGTRPFPSATRARGTGIPGGTPVRVADVVVRADDASTVIAGDGVEVTVLRLPGRGAPEGPSLSATWPGQDAPVALAVVSAGRS